MKNFNLKIGALAFVLALGTFTSCQQDNEGLLQEEDFFSAKEKELLARCSASNPIAKNFNGAQNCASGKKDPCTRKVNNNPNGNTNKGTIDDRSCAEDYRVIKNTDWGVYTIKHNSNHWDALKSNGTRLQPRIERSFVRANNKIGSYIEFTGTFRIDEVCNGGTYICQTKGTYSQRRERRDSRGRIIQTFSPASSSDPAICLLRAEQRSDGKIDIIAERIKDERSANGSGRENKRLLTVNKGQEYALTLKMGFRKDGNKTIHYNNFKIGNTNFFWNVPEGWRGLQSGFRYGAYRCRASGAKAKILWKNTKQKLVNK